MLKTNKICLTIALLSVWYCGSVSAVDYLDHFDDAVTDPNIWTVTGEVAQANSIVSCLAADPNDENSLDGEILSVNTFQFEDAEFLLKNMFDQRWIQQYEPLAAGFTGYITASGDQYILVRNDIAYGSQRLAVQVFKNGESKNLGYADVPKDPVSFDAHIMIYWSSTEVKVMLDIDEASGIENTFIETDPAWIPDQPMHFVHHCGASTSLDKSWDLEYVRVVPIQTAQYSDDFEDGVIDRDLWWLGGSQNVVEQDGLLSISIDPVDSSTSGFFSRNLSERYDSVRFGIRNFYDSRNLGIYDPVTIFFAGVYRQYHWILLRNDNVSTPNVTAPGLNLWTQDGYGMARYLGYFPTGDGAFHDIDVFIKWAGDRIDVEFDDLATPGVDQVVTVTDARWIPTDDEFGDPLDMFFTGWILPGSTDPISFDFVKIGPGCGDSGYLPGDYNNDCLVNLADFSLLALGWLDTQTLAEVQAMASDWLECNDPTDPGCGS